MKQKLSPDYLFEVSWEVCNKVSDLHTQLSTKTPYLTDHLKDKYICIGPDVWKETHKHPEFIEDTEIFRSWREYAAEHNIHVRIGRWQVQGEPIAILVDFTPLFGQKDKIFTNYWLKFGLNSLSGQWDYTEPAMFGYAAGQVIESFYQFHLTAHDRLVAHFHNWRTGTGVLYVNDNVPQAGTVFTMHESILKKTLRRKEMNLPTPLDEVDAGVLVSELDIVSKHSLEEAAALHADLLTVPTEEAADECQWILGIKPGLITPAGIVPSGDAQGDRQDAGWSEQISSYFTAYAKVLGNSSDRYDLYKDKKQPVRVVSMPPIESMRPKWKKVTIELKVPEDLQSLPEIARNIWWTWNFEAMDLFWKIDPELWKACEKNPVILMENLSMEHYERMLHDASFMKQYEEVVKNFHQYMEEGKQKKTKKIAYFSMEYGLSEHIKIYSGGLGVLAGDFLKQASDDNVDMIGIGLLYRYGYFTQSLSVHGEQLDTYHPHDFIKMFATPVRDESGERIKISIAFPGRTLHARVWKIDVGRIPLYLLDTDISENQSFDRFVTHQLYGGDWENRFKQEFLLGIGGIRILDALGIKPDVYHCNEGHAAFTGLERLRKYVQEENLSFHEALEVVRASSLFTTHTPVPAGHDFFSEDMLRTYMPHYADRLGISWETFMGLGKMNPNDPQEDYSMSVLAAKLAKFVNGVSKIHGKVSRNMFKDLYPGFFPEELHLSHVTNGVHFGTWTAKEWQQLYRKTFGDNYLQDVSNPEAWKKIMQVPDEEIWVLRNKKRKQLLEYINERLLSNLARRQETPRKIYQLMEAVSENTLTIGFARRFATYKRARLLFNDIDRLAKIVNNPDMPVQFIYAGKAHPADKAGQDLIKHILEISRRKEFLGKIIFLEDYDMELGRELVKGVDIWLNTPTRPMEASGTSGQKAVLNGIMNFSVLDGWWAEGYTEEAGWKLKEEKTFENQEFQDELDAETVYNILESEIVPMFYTRNKENIPEEWVRWTKNCIARIAPHYTNKRMMDDYFRLFYNKLFESSRKFEENDHQLARAMVHWKNKVIQAWDNIEVVEKRLVSNSGKRLLLGDLFVAELKLNVGDLKSSDFGVEVVFGQKSPDGSREIVSVYEMEQIKTQKNQVTFRCEVPAKRTGSFNYAFRMFPKHPELAHRQDFSLIKWI
ncbi:MAG: alpha-glucan family phosphorylase [Bacteroidia bacterium]|nr:MAG: alpha-glucan family phosphorylase [Bacteroidia bacterium]